MCSFNMIITDSASLWCFAARRSAQAMAGPMSEANALGLACEARLAVNLDKLTELAIIMLKEH